MSKPSLVTLRRYVLFGLVLLLHIAVLFALSQWIIFRAPVEAKVFERVQIPKPVAPPPPPPPEPAPNLIAPSENITPPAPAVTSQVITAFNPAVTIPTADITPLPMPNMAMVSPTPSAGNSLTSTGGQGSVTGDIGVLSSGLKNGTPADSFGFVAFSQATLGTASMVDKIEDGYPNVTWGIANPATINPASLKADPVTHRLHIQDNPQCVFVDDPTGHTLSGTFNGLKHVHPKNLVMILDLTDPSDRNEELAEQVVKALRDNHVRLFIIPMTVNGGETAINGPVYRCLSSYVTESGGVVYFPGGVPKDYDTNPQP